MVRVSPRALVTGGLSGALVASAIALAAADDQVVAAAKPQVAAVEQAARKARASGSSTEPDTRGILRSFDPRVHTREGDHLWAPLANGARARLTLDPDLQARAQSILKSYQVPYGALVALEPSSGRVLAYVSHSSANP